MKRHLICILASAAVAVTGCNETTETNAGGGQGTIRIACKADISIDAEAKASPKGTRAEITAPAGSEFALRITGAGFDRSWESVAAFDAEENVFDTSFLKLKELRLEYSLPRHLCSKTRVFQGITVGVYATNLFCWTNFPLYDPEAGYAVGSSISRGIEAGAYPMTRTYGINLKLDF